jgi:hypothetical protein
MVQPRSTLAGISAAGTLMLALGLVLSAAPAPAASVPAKVGMTSGRALLASRELWATIDVCDAPDQANTVGIRGSMPGDGEAHDRMYMSFRLQYMNSRKHWVNLASATSPAFVAVGGGASPRQGGSSFELKPMTGKPAVTLRGVVDFQWRHGKTVLMSTAEPTSAAHKSVVGADPAGFSAATCLMG